MANDELFNIICSDKEIAQFVRKGSWVSGSSTEVHSYTFWDCGTYPTIEIQLDVDIKGKFPKYKFYAKDEKKLDAIIRKYMCTYSNIKDAYLITNDGSCPPIMRFQLYSK